MLKLNRTRWLRWSFSVIIILCLTLLLWNYKWLDWSWYYGRFDVRQTSSEPLITVHQTIPQHCGPGEVVPFYQKLSPVNGTKTLLVSAYQEHRTKRREVRVTAVVLRSEEVTYHCHLCCHDQLHQSVGVRHVNPFHFRFAHGAADIMCPLPPSCKTVSHIALTSADAKDEKKFLEVKNQRVKNDSFHYNFTVCISTMFEFNNALQLFQSLEMLQILGVNKVAIYVVSHSPEVKHLLNYYVQKGFVDVIPWSITKYLKPSRSWLPHLSPGDIHYFGQMPTLNDCIYRYMYESRYVVLHDVDELILPQSVESWPELLPMLIHKYGRGLCFLFENHVFPNSIKLPPPSHQTLPPQSRWDKVPGVNILNHLYEKLRVTKSSKKMMINPRLVFGASVHQLWKPPGKCIPVHKSIARMYHIRSQRETKLSPKEFSYDGRLLNYSTKLTSAVNNALIESGLLPQDSIV